MSTIQFPNVSDNNGSLSRETTFEVLRARRRRHVLHFLFKKKPKVDMYELTQQIAAWENDTTPQDVTSKQRMRVYTALRQSHLPKMDDEGVIYYDPDRGTIELSEAARELEVYLKIVPQEEIPWSEYYLGLGAVSVGLLMATWLGVFPYGLLPPLTLATVIVGLFTVSAAAHTIHDRQLRRGAEGVSPRE